MKYKLPRPIIEPEISKIISRELRKQKTAFPRATKAELKELAEVAKAIEESSLPPCYVCKKLPHNLGRGIFLHPDAEPILKDSVIATYSGVVSIVPQNKPDDSCYAFDPLSDMFLEKEEQFLLAKESRYHPRRLYSLKLDAYKQGNFTRFINHSEKPNVAAHTISIPSNPYGLVPSSIEIVYFAKKTIRPGEQLLVNYEGEEKSYWGILKIKPFYMTPKTFTLTSALKLNHSADK